MLYRLPKKRLQEIWIHLLLGLCIINVSIVVLNYSLRSKNILLITLNLYNKKVRVRIFNET
jgi:hypothetical protein